MFYDYLTTNNIIIFSIFVFFVLLIIARKKRSKKIPGLNHKYYGKGDPEAIAEYNKKHNKNILLSMEEKIELSWKFLFEITEYILSKFSPADQKQTLEIGKKLKASGFSYIHVVDFAIKKEQYQQIGISAEKVKDNDQNKAQKTL